MLETAAQWMTILAGIAALLGLVWAGSTVLKKKKSQIQIVKGSSSAIQSGRDTKVEVNGGKADSTRRK